MKRLAACFHFMKWPAQQGVERMRPARFMPDDRFPKPDEADRTRRQAPRCYGCLFWVGAEGSAAQAAGIVFIEAADRGRLISARGRIPRER